MFNLGALCFGLVVGWVTYRTMRRTKTTGLGDIATVIGAVGGTAVVSLFPQETGAFSSYCIGLAVGFFGYLIVAMNIDRRATRSKSARAVSKWLGGEPIEENNTEDADAELPIAGS